MTLHSMSDKELSRLEILRDFTGGRLTTPAAAELLGLEHRQVQRLWNSSFLGLRSNRIFRANAASAPADIGTDQ